MKRSLLFNFIVAFTFPLAAQWQTMAALPSSFSFPVVVVLRGNIHVMGGGASGGATDLHLRYRPTLDIWDTMAPVPYKAQQPAGAVVNGKIYFCGGGFPNSGTPLKKNYFYDVDSNKWFPAADMPVATVIHKAVAFDNKLYVLSGQPNKQLCEYYDPSTNTWTQKNALPDPYFWYGAIVSNANAIYRFGGGGYTGPQKLAYKYDKVNDSWDPLPDMPVALHGADATVINDTLIYITGGYNNGDKDRVWKFNTNSKTYVSIGVMPAARTYHNMITLNNCIYSIGGNNNSIPSVATSLIRYCPTANEVGIRTSANEETKPYTIVNTSGNVSLLFDGSITPGNGTVQVFDASGRLCYSSEINDKRIEIELRKFSSVCYFIQIKCNSKMYVEKIIPLQ